MDIFNAVKLGNLDSVREYIKMNADINARDKIGQTALHIAAGRNNTDIIKLLIKAKAKLNLKAINGLTAYEFAAQNGMEEAALLLRRF